MDVDTAVELQQLQLHRGDEVIDEIRALFSSCMLGLQQPPHPAVAK